MNVLPVTIYDTTVPTAILVATKKDARAVSFGFSPYCLRLFFSVCENLDLGIASNNNVMKSTAAMTVAIMDPCEMRPKMLFLDMNHKYMGYTAANMTVFTQGCNSARIAINPIYMKIQADIEIAILGSVGTLASILL